MPKNEKQNVSLSIHYVFQNEPNVYIGAQIQQNESKHAQEDKDSFIAPNDVLSCSQRSRASMAIDTNTPFIPFQSVLAVKIISDT